MIQRRGESPLERLAKPCRAVLPLSFGWNKRLTALWTLHVLKIHPVLIFGRYAGAAMEQMALSEARIFSRSSLRRAGMRIKAMLPPSWRGRDPLKIAWPKTASGKR